MSTVSLAAPRARSAASPQQVGFAETLDHGDLVAVVAAWLATFALVAMSPPLIGDQDAALFAAYTQRILAGQLPYRDFETYFSPGALVLLAIPFRLLGSSAQVMLAVHSAIHASLVAAVYVLARTLGVSRSVAFLAGTMQVGWGLAIWPNLSPHWLGTLLLALVFLVLARNGARRPAGDLRLGVALGFLTWVQHHKGAMATPLVLAYVALDHAMVTGVATTSMRDLWRRLLRIGGGYASVVAVGFGGLIGIVGLPAAFDGLVVGPLVRYPRQPVVALPRLRGLAMELGLIRDQWPGILLEPLGRGLVAWLAWLAAIAYAAIGALAPANLDRAASRRRRGLVLAYLVVAGVVNGYRGGFVLAGFMLPAIVVGVAVLFDDALAALSRRAAEPPLCLVPIGVGVIFCLLASGSIRERRLWYPVRSETKFGRIALPDLRRARAAHMLVRRAGELGIGELYCHTYCPELGLILGLTNPTRFEILLPGMSPMADYDEVRRHLESRRPPFVGLGVIPTFDPADPIVPWILESYVAPIDLPRNVLPLSNILVRKDIATETWNRLLRESGIEPDAGQQGGP